MFSFFYLTINLDRGVVVGGAGAPLLSASLVGIRLLFWPVKVFLTKLGPPFLYGAGFLTRALICCDIHACMSLNVTHHVQNWYGLTGMKRFKRFNRALVIQTKQAKSSESAGSRISQSSQGITRK